MVGRPICGGEILKYPIENFKQVQLLLLNEHNLRRIFTSGPLVAPKIGAMLRIRSKWEICSECAPKLHLLLKHKGYYLAEKSEHKFWFD